MKTGVVVVPVVLGNGGVGTEIVPGPGVEVEGEANVGVDTSNLRTKGDLDGDQAGGNSEAVVWHELDAATEFDITYSTSGEAGEAGPKGDMFLMPAATIGIMQTHVVSMSSSADKKTCTIHASTDTSWEILLHLSGFYYIQASDVESRVMPMLTLLVGDAGMKLECMAKKTVKSCCKNYKKGDKGSACHVKQDPRKNKIDSLDRYCENKYKLGSDGYNGCRKVTAKTTLRVTNALTNWNSTLNRNYNMLGAIEVANAGGDPKKALKALCASAAKICPFRELAPESLIAASKANGAKRVPQSDEKKKEYREYNVISFGGGGAGLDYVSLLSSLDDFKPLETEVEVMTGGSGNEESELALSMGVGVSASYAGVGGGLEHTSAFALNVRPPPASYLDYV